MNKSLVVLWAILTILVSSCSDISIISRGDRSNLYSAKFLVKIGKVKETYRRGDTENALKYLKDINEDSLLPSEKALRRNLIGVILFSKEKYEQAIDNFDRALATSRLDDSLTAQIYLNLSSTYYKLEFLEKAYATITMSDFTKLSPKEAEKHHLLKYNLARKLEKREASLASLVHYLGSKKTINELRKDAYFENLITNFFKFESGEKMTFLRRFEEYRYLAVFYLAYLEAEKLFSVGLKDEAQDLLEWIVDESDDKNHEVLELVKNFSHRIEGSMRVDPTSIGIVLPLSGKKKNFGERVLRGIDSAILGIKNTPNSKVYNIHIKDSKGSGAVGAFAIQELIQKRHVAAIIGGLFSSEATKEYLEAKKHGVPFISLSQIYLPKEQKNHLLVEIPGSIESQLGQLFSEDMLKHFGTRAAILYPKGPMGDAYIAEFWRRAKLSNVEVNSVLNFDKSHTDYRDPVKNLLGLKFPRERQEELDLYSEIYALEKKTSSRRIQTLRPKIDFDWIFIPAYPREALQIIPAFRYFDAFRLNVIGGPSWRSKSLSKQSSKIGTLFFIGDDVRNQELGFLESFQKRYGTRPKIIELMAFDSFKLLDTILGNRNFSSREELDSFISEQDTYEGLTGKWTLVDGVWLKNMISLKLKHGKFERLSHEDKSEG